MLYADYNATSPLSAEISAVMQPFLGEYFVNPSSLGGEAGEIVSQAIEIARGHVASLVGATPEQIVFTSGGTESCFLAIWGAFLASHNRRVIISSVEHPAVYESVKLLEQPPLGAAISVIGVNSSGHLLDTELSATLKEESILSLMLANNETGVVFPIKQISKQLPKGVTFHTDATQAIGKVPVSFQDLGVDLLSFSGHKFGAPKGVGALIVRKDAQWISPMKGGGQERGARGGTLATAQIVALGEAARLAQLSLGAKKPPLQESFERRLFSLIGGVRINGEEAARLPNTSSVQIDGVLGKDVVLEMLREGVTIAAGSACSSESSEPSRVLRSMGRSTAECFSTVRISFGPESTSEDVDKILEALVKVVGKLRGQSEAKLKSLLSESTAK